MNARGGAKSRRRRVMSFFAQSLDVGDFKVNGVDRGPTVCSRAEQHLGPGVTGVVTVAATLVTTRAPAERDQKILGTPHERNGRFGRGNGRRLEDTLGGL